MTKCSARGIAMTNTPFYVCSQVFALFWDITVLFSLLLMFPTLLDVVYLVILVPLSDYSFNKISILSLLKTLHLWKNTATQNI